MYCIGLQKVEFYLLTLNFNLRNLKICWYTWVTEVCICIYIFQAKFFTFLPFRPNLQKQNDSWFRDNKRVAHAKQKNKDPIIMSGIAILLCLNKNKCLSLFKMIKNNLVDNQYSLILFAITQIEMLQTFWVFFNGDIEVN